jgi:putative transposase
VNGFADYYNHQRYHESLSNLTPADVYFGKSESLLKKKKAVENQRLFYDGGVDGTRTRDPRRDRPVF